ncbi:hypothetical protein M2404_004060 [Rheinheimera pacifica]|uniref:hypothetical protein n=1 Tax=Rheinheimera pacifica TaxID=173990 RepID=UPI002169A7E6|nr:hypothetical protein [Rheinheimera pacifica]MCS4309683.1 hypothetical protein [Rheinheimera pacifica]
MKVSIKRQSVTGIAFATALLATIGSTGAFAAVSGLRDVININAELVHSNIRVQTITSGVKVTKEDIKVGAEVFKRPDGTCFRITSELENLYAVESEIPGVIVQLPEMVFTEAEVRC